MSQIEVTGDFEKLARLERALAGGREMLRDISVSMAEETITLIARGFRRASDPYGGSWQAKQAADGRAPLHGETTRLKRTWHRSSATPEGFGVASGVNYASPHQSPQRRSDGRLKRPRRMMIPDAARGLSATWRTAYDDTVSDALTEFMSQGMG